MPIYPQFHKNEFDPAKEYVESVFTEDGYFFAQDLSETQSQIRHQMKANGDALFRDGDVASGGQIVVNDTTGATSLEAGSVYLQGHVRDLAPADMTLPVTGEVSVGVIIETRVITMLEDPSLKFNDQRFKTHGQPRAARLQEKCRWGASTEALADTPVVSYRFFPVYRIVNGVVVDNSPPPQITGLNAEIARYDRDANGNYVASGFKVTYLGLINNERTYSIEEGVANVRGLKIDRAAALRVAYADDPDLETINAEPHYFADGGNGTMIFTLNRTPIDEILDVSVLTQVTENVLRGQTSGGRDPLPHAQIATIIEIKQGATTYAVGSDFTLIGDEVDWSAGGVEPAPGSTYSVTYRYKKSIDPDAWDDNTVTVSGAVTDSEVDIDYKWRRPRTDILAVNTLGEIVCVKGVSTAYNPVPPQVPDDLLPLATIANTFATGTPPEVRNVATRSVPYDDIQDMRKLLVTAFDQLARVELRQDADRMDPAAKNGIFVDNFVDDDLRDQGIPQTLAIIDGELTLPIAATVLDGALSPEAWSLNYEVSAFVSQPLQTGSMKVNPYMAFDPLPAIVTLDPAVDQWTTVNETWQSAVTRSLTRGSGNASSTSTSTSVEVLREETTESTTLRQRDVAFTVSGFDANEVLASLTFDGVSVLPDPAPVADENGAMSGTFQVPPDIPVGAKMVEALGTQGSFGGAEYIGRGTITLRELRQVTTRTTTFWWAGRDPLATTFLTPRGFHCAGIRVTIMAIGDTEKPIIMQLRETTTGLPNQTVIADAIIDMTSVSVGETVDVLFDLPPWWPEGAERAFVFLTDDADHALGIAETGKYDPNHGWVTAQANTNMVLLSSSNARTWTAHQNMDLTCDILEATFTEASRTVPLGTIAAEQLTDLLANAGVDTPAAGTEIELTFTRTDGSAIRVAPNSVVSLSEKITEDLQVHAVLKGPETGNASPILFPNVQVVLGTLADEGDYVTRAFTGGTNADVLVRFEAFLPGNSTVTVEVREENGDYTAVSHEAHVEAGDGWYEHTYRLSGFTAPTTAVKLTAAGTALHRPRVRKLKALSLAV